MYNQKATTLRGQIGLEKPAENSFGAFNFWIGQKKIFEKIDKLLENFSKLFPS